MRILPLGAGQDVGRSCIIVILDCGKTIMLDCGLHPGRTDASRFPEFSKIPYKPNLNQKWYASGSGITFLASPPTKALLALMLEDFRRISPETGLTSEMIKECCLRVQVINLEQKIIVDDLHVTAFYAGHVLGAVMFYVECHCNPKKVHESFIYTGDFNSYADRHLGPAQIPFGINPDVLITESTYCTTIRDSKRVREREFLKKIQETLDRGGKVLIPVFALGRAQELCLLVETYWRRIQSNIPIYFAGNLAEKANAFYKQFIQ